ncbi:MAG: serine hydrolase domain-containing protein [Pseudomonadota bacterium]
MNISARQLPLDQIAAAYVETGKTAGMLTAVKRHGEIKHLNCAGYADRETATPIREDTLFRIYSMSKPVTSVALMTLFEKGHFQLDDAAKRWIPELAKMQVYEQGPIESDITIRQLLTHTAGFSYGFNPEQCPVDKQYAIIWRKEIREKSLCEILPELFQIPLIAQPGTRWHYSIATDICGYLVELISGMPFADYLQQTLFEPLGMTDTGFEVSLENQSRLASLYSFDPDDPLKRIETANDSPLIPAVTGKPVRLHSGGAGLVSSLADYLRFAQMMLNRGESDGLQILKPETVALMTQNQISEKQLPLSFNGVRAGEYYGYGFGLGYCVTIDTDKTAAAGTLGDFGWGGLADTYCWVDPEHNMIAILLQQFMPSLFHPGRLDFRNAVYSSLAAGQLE